MEKEKKKERPNRPVAQFAAGFAFIAVSYYLKNSIHLDSFSLSTPQERLTFSIRWLFISSLSILIAVFGVLRVRGNTDAIDPIGGRAEHLVDLPNRILRNTVEQFFLHVVGILTLTTYLDADSMNTIPLLVCLFLFGRICYIVGYTSAPMKRAFGFVLTFQPTLATYAYCLYRFVDTFIL